jgi:hypothetical protein
MAELAPSETTMWGKLPPDNPGKMSDSEINDKYNKRELRIVTETNREQLPNFVEALNRVGWMDLRPFYQRRPRWDVERQSKLIESFIMNIPVPPLFVYESDLAKYEVMDGQQRITAIKEFYANKFPLKGLEQWPELNGRIYDKLPADVKKGIDRRSISYIVLLKESATTTDEEALLRQQVFERLNTGGVELSNQEIRHCIYHGKFDDLLLKLSRHAALRKAWGLPAYDPAEETNLPKKLLDSAQFSQMRDCEVVLRFFALRHAEQYRRGMHGFLDLYMLRTRKFTDQDLELLERLFNNTISLASEVFGDLLFRPWDIKDRAWSDHPQVAFADAVLTSFGARLDKAGQLRSKKKAIVDNTPGLFEAHPQGTFTGQKNSKKDVQDRIRLFGEMLDKVLGA